MMTWLWSALVSAVLLIVVLSASAVTGWGRVKSRAPLAVAAVPFDAERFLNAVAEVEGATAGELGARGERGPWQLMPVVARRWGGSSREAARRHLAWLMIELGSRGASVCPFNVALCWNAGLERAMSGRARMSSYDYALRVQNVYDARGVKP